MLTRTLVTGGSGFTGRHLIRSLAERGHEVHTLCRRVPSAPIDGAGAVHRADLVDAAELTRIVVEIRPHAVVHLAAVAFVAHGAVDELYRNNVLGTRHLLEALTHVGNTLTSVLVTSSGNVYGSTPGPLLDETTPPAPVNDYGVTKVAVEYLAHMYAGRIPITIVRPFNYTGRGQSLDFVVPKIVAHARARAPVIELGNLDVSRDFSDVRTVVDGYIRLLEAPVTVGSTYNICSGTPASLRQIITSLGRIAGWSPEVTINPALVRANEVRTLTGSPAKFEREVGALRHIPLEATLRWMLED